MPSRQTHSNISVKTNYKTHPGCRRQSYLTGMDKHYLSEPCRERVQVVDLAPGQKLIDRFTIKSLLGRGSYCMVYLASDHMRSMDVALKVVPVTTESDAHQLRHEIQLHSEILDYSHVICQYDIHSAVYEGSILLLISMEYADGGSFRQWLKDNRGNLEKRQSEGVRFFKEACCGVKSLHNVGIVHLDLKPENLLFVGGVLKVSDLGISRFMHDVYTNSQWSRNHSTTSSPGTPAYMSPEQITAPHPDDVDFRADIYSLGIILFEICHPRCRPPFGGSEQQLHHRHLHVPVPALEYADVNEVHVVSRCLQKDPPDRYSGITELINELENGVPDEEVIEEPSKPREHESVEQLWEQACQFVSDNNLKVADRVCSQILNILPEHDDAMHMSKEIQDRYRQAEQFYRAIESSIGCKPLSQLLRLLVKAVDIYPEHPAGNLVQTQLLSVACEYGNSLREGEEAIASGHWREAHTFLEKTQQLNPGFGPIIELVEFVKEVQQRIADTRRDIDTAIEQQDRDRAMLLFRNLDQYVEQIKGIVR